MLKINFFCLLLNFSFRGAPVPKRGYPEHTRSILIAYLEHTQSILGAYPLLPHLGVRAFWRRLFFAPFLAPKNDPIWAPKCPEMVPIWVHFLFQNRACVWNLNLCHPSPFAFRICPAT